MIKNEYCVLDHSPSLASSPHPSVSGLVITVCACIDFPRKTWGKCREFGYHRLLSAIVRRLSLLERQVLHLKKSRHAQYATYTMVTTFSPGFPGKINACAHRPLSEGCGLEARLITHPDHGRAHPSSHTAHPPQ